MEGFHIIINSNKLYYTLVVVSRVRPCSGVFTFHVVVYMHYDVVVVSMWFVIGIPLGIVTW